MPQPVSKVAKRGNTTSPHFIKTPLRDMHRFGLDGMLQGCGGNLKHFQNRSPSSLHGKQHKLTKSPLVVLHFYNLSQCFAWPAQEAINMCRSSLPSYKSWLCKNLASETWSTGRSPVQIFDLTHRLCALASQLQAKFSIFRFGAMKPFRPSNIKCCHPSGRYADCFNTKALPVPDSTLQLCWSASGFSAPCGGSCCSLQWMQVRNPIQRNLWDVTLGS